MMLANGVSWAQAYPAKPIRFIVGFAAGGGTDFVARVIAKRLTESLGQSIVVERATRREQRGGREDHGTAHRGAGGEGLTARWCAVPVARHD